MKLVRVSCILLIAVLLASCRTPDTVQQAAEAEITISVAASTVEVVEQVAQAFTAKTGIKVKINSGPSSGLANQILAGAPVDVFLSANREWAEQVSEAGLASESIALLTNKLVIVVPKGNPAKVQKPDDLHSDSVRKIALAGENVPAGKYADQALTKQGLLEPLTKSGKIARGQDVRTALNYVEHGEAEAGIVYATDARISSKVQVVYAFDPSQHDEIVYMLVQLKRGADKPAAKQFMEQLQSAEADKIYVSAGFERLREP